jgi:hypothetical protein
MRARTLDFGPLPVEIVNRILAVSLPPGAVIFRAAEQDHAYEKHSEQYLRCLPFIRMVIAQPTYIGQSPHHLTGFELVKVTDDGLHILVALTFATDGAGAYPIQSLYPIRRDTVMGRLRKKHLFVA